MRDYCSTKQFNLSDTELKVMAESCYLFFESKGWKDTKFWPPLAMRWALTSRTKSNPIVKPVLIQSPRKGESVRDRILRERDSHVI
ncbi:MAG: hypothetical protein IMZ70_08385 [Candidatus Atribacteria bacterium]|nr:hypothetical protein [Candidatus Atribacteria bacterium]